jgi:glucose dehydrogenase
VKWLKGVVGVVLMLIGLVWVGQGTDLIQNSPLMSGSATWAVIGLVVLVVGTLLLRSALRASRSAGARSA